MALLSRLIRWIVAGFIALLLLNQMVSLTTTTVRITSTEPPHWSNEKAEIGTAENVHLSDQTLITRNTSKAANINTLAPNDSELSSWNTTTPTINSSSSSTFSFHFPNVSQRFPLASSAAWLQDFLTTQPTSTHLQSLNNPHQKFIVMTCHKYEQTKLEACGGFADRIKLIPYFMWLAKQTNRMLLIYYTKPHALEHFFEPPPDPDISFEWRVPEGYFHDELNDYANRTHGEYMMQRWMEWHMDIFQPAWNATRVIFVNNNLAHSECMAYLEQSGKVTTSNVQGVVFRHLFYPTPALQHEINVVVQAHHLVLGHYVGLHMRAKYVGNAYIATRNGTEDKEGGGLMTENLDVIRDIRRTANNAMNCAMSIMPDTPIVYVASDTNEPIEYLLKESVWPIAGGTTNVNFTHPYPKYYYSQSPPLKPPSGPRKFNTTKHAPKVVARLDFEQEALHFDSDTKRPQPIDMYPIFVDLWILGHAKCISQGVGGYSELASQLTGNLHTCRIFHRDKDQGILKCPNYLDQEEEQQQE
jgi:hypothetical protein